MKSADFIKNKIINELFWANQTNLKRVKVIDPRSYSAHLAEPSIRWTWDTCQLLVRSPNLLRASRMLPRTSTSWTRIVRPTQFHNLNWSSKQSQPTRMVFLPISDTSSSTVCQLISLNVSTRTIKATTAAILRKTQGANMTLSTRNKTATAYSFSANLKWIAPWRKKAPARTSVTSKSSSHSKKTSQI